MRRLPQNSIPHDGETLRRVRKLRREMTLSETMLWQEIRRDRLGFRFRRQYPVGPFVLDFFCAEAALCVEVDGEMHDPERDRRRDLALLRLGVETLRIPSLSLFAESERLAWIEHILARCRERSCPESPP